MLKRLLVVLLLLAVSAPVAALEYTDVYYDPDEAGWGMFVVQSDTFQFVTFFIYGPDGKPTWYAAGLNQDANGNYAGTLFAATGTYFGSPWQGYASTAVGTASFQPIDIYSATLTYTLTNGPTVTRTVQRQPLTGYVLAGHYSGSMSGTVTGCTDPNGNTNAFRSRYNLAVTQNGDTSATLVFTFVDTDHVGLVCTLTGPLTHYGRLYKMANAQASCTGPGAAPGPFTDAVDSFHPTGQGIEGRWSGPQGGGCVLAMRFAAVFNSN